MPPYYAAGLTIRLETHEAGALEDTIVTANSGAESKRLLAEADLALSSGERLSEEPVDCLAEQGDSALKFLGKNQTMPFYCMAVNRRPPFVATFKQMSDCSLTVISVYGASVGDQLDPASGADNENEPATASKPKIKLRLRSTRSSTHTALPEDQQAFQPAPQPPSSDATYPTVGMPLGPTRTPTPVSSIPMGQPLSLDYRPVTLKVQLDPVKSFCRSPRVVFKDLKMEVFFNGVLTHSTLVPARERNKPESLNHVFSGSCASKSVRPIDC